MATSFVRAGLWQPVDEPDELVAAVAVGVSSLVLLITAPRSGLMRSCVARMRSCVPRRCFRERARREPTEVARFEGRGECSALPVQRLMAQNGIQRVKRRRKKWKTAA